MSGLIAQAMGRALSDAGTTIGGYMMRGTERDIETERREREREEDRLRREADREDRQRFQEEMYRARTTDAAARTSDARRASGSGDQFTYDDIGQNGRAEGIIAARAGMNIPEMRAVRASRTGDNSAFMRDTVVGGTTTEDAVMTDDGEYSDAISRKYAQREIKMKKELPAGFDKQIRAKSAALAEIETAFLLGKDNQAFQAGEMDRFQRGNAEGVRDGRMSAGEAGTINAVSDGKPLFTVRGDTQFQQYTGADETTDVGKSKITKNLRPPAAGGGGRGDNVTLQSLKAELVAVDKDIKIDEDTIKSLRRGMKDQSRKERENAQSDIDAIQKRIEANREQKGGITARLSAFSDNRGGPPAASAGAGSIPSPASKADFDKLPPGTRFRAPDGSIRIK